eukprot:TRINITY_DN1732_c0_g5_i3.p1 TRINITY_DN1732_c0_g5~~TRINITY_DN1732_c0_g5_i3.p1  ORF type:complete len:1331 (+),score=239.19 TRINITY_DN1732_c0_g5_i3:41155-45147(+)
MLRFINLVLAILVFVPSSWAGVQITENDWEQKVLESKNKIRSVLGEQFPYQSNVFKKASKPEKISVDITGVETLVLVTNGTADGKIQDHAVWADAKLIKANGEAVYLDELPFHTATSEVGRPVKNRTLSKSKITLKRKTYEHGIFLHANGEVSFKLDKKYVRFESVIGIDDKARWQASVSFKVQNVPTAQLEKQLLADYPELESLFLSQVDVNTSDWLSTKDASVEKQAVSNLIKQLNIQDHFKKQWKDIEKLPQEDQLQKYLNLFVRVYEIYSLQKEMKWVTPESIRLAYENMKSSGGFNASKYAGKLNYIEKLYPSASKGMYYENEKAIEHVKEILKKKKEILLANPLLDFDNLLVVRYKLGDRARVAMGPEIGTQNNNWSCHMSMRRKGFNCELAMLSNLRGEVQSETIYKPNGGHPLTSLRLHWDADRLMFTSVNEKDRWQLFELDLESKKAHQLTQVAEDDLHFFDGTYLPNGKVVVSSNIGYQGVPCVNGKDVVGNLCSYDPKTKHLRRISFGQENDWSPEVMNNGRLMQLRWEYTDNTHYFSRIMLHMNPDGTNKKELYGSGSYWPNSMFDAKPLPGKNNTQFIAVVSGHHGIARSGRLVMFDPKKGRQEDQGVMQEIPYRNRKIVPTIADRLVDGVWPQFLKPQVLSKDYFLVTAKMSPESLWGVYLVDVFDNVTPLAMFEGEGVTEAVPVVKKETPPVIPEKVNEKDLESTVYIQDIYTGLGTKGVKRGTIKELRILAYEFAYINTPSNHMAQGIQSGWDIKRLLGTVPVEEDGSVIFKIPANTPISLQPLDKDGAAVQLMRSWITGMPGEIVSCTGCHEDQNTIAQPKFTLASRKTPIKITAPKGGVRSFTFEHEVQPILDRRCTACHNGEDAKPNFKDTSKDKLFGFSKSYLALHPYVNRQGPEADIHTMKPMEYHVSTSDLIQQLRKGHKNVELSEEEWRTLYTWIDFNAPYNGSFDASDACGCDQITRRQELMQKYNNKSVDWKKEIQDYVEKLNAEGEIKPIVPKKVAPLKPKKVKAKNWPFSSEVAKEMQKKAGKEPLKIDLGQGLSINLKYIPAGSFVMGANTGDHEAYPPSKQSVKKGFWMSEFEVTNDQFKALFPEHDSRYLVQFWKDHTNPGYPANEPKQPVVRVSWEEAMSFCEKIAKKTGLKVTLPTESQWEWAARSGSSDDFWFGDQTVDFAPYANLADMQLANMAVSGVDPQPMSKNDKHRPYFDFIPRSKVVDDGSMLGVEVGTYQANPWGLYDMIGNVSEWTRTDYREYPYVGKDGRNANKTGVKKVVRGGSWRDRSKKATSSYRRAFESWQKVFNVGFRIIVEE